MGKKIKATKNTSLVVKNNYNLNSPVQMAGMANVLKNYIIKNNLSVQIVGRDYVMVEGWQYAGGLLGTFPRIVEVKNLSTGQEIKWQAQAEIVNVKTGKVISTGFAICSKKESKKATFDEYAILSMAQTRAIGKAFRNVIGWVIKFAGYESTPSEEMVKAGEDPVINNSPAPEKINQQEEVNLLRMMLNAGYGSKGKAIAGINRLLKINIKELSDLTKSQAKSVTVALLQKKHQKNG